MRGDAEFSLIRCVNCDYLSKFAYSYYFKV